MKELVLARIAQVMTGVIHHSKSWHHFNRLKTRLENGQKLTKKMQENLGWITKDVEYEQKLQNEYLSK